MIQPIRRATPIPQPDAKPAPSKAFSLTAPAEPAPSPLPAGPLSAPDPRKLIARMLDDEAKVDDGLHAAMSGRRMSAQELLVLQAQVIQYSQEIEVASRLVDKATSGVKQVLQTQV
jgi:hypothetical protein